MPATTFHDNTLPETRRNRPCFTWYGHVRAGPWYDFKDSMRVPRITIAISLLFGCCLWLASRSTAAEDDGFYWLTNYSDALREAKKTQKPIFLEFRCEA